MFIFEWFSCPDGITPNSSLTGLIDTAIWMHYMDANQTAGEET